MVLCEYGNHHVDEGTIARCAICDKTVCLTHTGNISVEGGSYVACLSHVREVAELNKQWYQLFQMELCQYGHHYVNERVHRCIICAIAVCREHRGDTPDDCVSCAFHVKEAASLDKAKSMGG